MSVSAIFGTRLVAPPQSATINTINKATPKLVGLKGGGSGGTGLVIECSSRPTKKATAHHKKTRPRKTQAWDIRRKGPTVYPQLPPLPPDWTLATDADSAADADAASTLTASS